MFLVCIVERSASDKPVPGLEKGFNCSTSNHDAVDLNDDALYSWTVRMIARGKDAWSVWGNLGGLDGRSQSRNAAKG